MKIKHRMVLNRKKRAIAHLDGTSGVSSRMDEEITRKKDRKLDPLLADQRPLIFDASKRNRKMVSLMVQNLLVF